MTNCSDPLASNGAQTSWSASMWSPSKLNKRISAGSLPDARTRKKKQTRGPADRPAAADCCCCFLADKYQSDMSSYRSERRGSSIKSPLLKIHHKGSGLPGQKKKIKRSEKGRLDCFYFRGHHKYPPDVLTFMKQHCLLFSCGSRDG